MRQLLLSLTVAALVLGLTGPLAGAQKEPPVIEPMTAAPIPIGIGPYGTLTTCQMGNLHAPAWSITSFIYPPDNYKLAFDPLATCSVCPAGFKVNTIHVVLQAKRTCTVVLSVDFEEAAYPTPDCTAPGPVQCTSNLYQFNLGVGTWDLPVPITCDCLTPGHKYLLGVHFDSRSCTAANLGLILDAGPAALCLNWNDYGAGWGDLLVDYPTWPGQLLFFADTECCDLPVSTQSNTWGAIKDLYRN